VQKGFTLAELTVNIAIYSLIILVVVGFLSQMSFTSHFMVLGEVRNDVHAQLDRALKDEKAITYSRKMDPILGACFKKGVDATPCPAQQMLGVSLYDSSGAKLSGPPNAPVYYTMDGALCTDSTVHCEVEVISVVRAQGLPLMTTQQLAVLPPSSDKAHEIVEIKYSVALKSKIPNQPATRIVSGSVVIDTQDVEDIP
jgi:hypothetical protein